MYMLDKALIGSRRYWIWLAFLLLLVAVGFVCYCWQLVYGLGITGMSRDISWGIYIGQFTFFVGIAASAVMVVLPYYFHDVKEFGRITILGEFLAIAAVIMCMLFIFVDMGQPARVLNVLFLSHAAFHDVLGHDFARRLSAVECGHLGCNAGQRVQASAPAALAPARDPALRSLGHQHSYGHGFFV